LTTTRRLLEEEHLLEEESTRARLVAIVKSEKWFKK
jgi:hypothetical protein